MREEKAMKVKELIQELTDYDMDFEIEVNLETRDGEEHFPIDIEHHPQFNLINLNVDLSDQVLDSSRRIDELEKTEDEFNGLQDYVAELEADVNGLNDRIEELEEELEESNNG